jgi:hypothetical protein
VIRSVLVALGAIAYGAICAAPTAAQTVDFLPRSAFHMGAEHLSSDDPRYVWDANFGGDIDFVDYGSGRVTFLANYEVGLGEEYHAFDPNQGNYILDGSASHRFGGYEAAFVFHHESRHLSDRFKRQPVDWNMIGGRLQKSLDRFGAHIDTRADLRGVILRSSVDYKWEFEGEARGAYPVRGVASVIGGLRLQFLGVNDEQNRGTQTGFRAESGVRFQGKGAAVDLFVSGERRVDPYPLQFGAARWITAGFRMSTR